jgi:NAD(P)-dependent dehydrogenase (short-subunit alcohol dehydrogenase family)
MSWRKDLALWLVVVVMWRARVPPPVIDVLISNVAVSPAFGPFFDTTEDAWDKLFDINIKAAFLLTKEALPYLRFGSNVLYVSSVRSGSAPGRPPLMTGGRPSLSSSWSLSGLRPPALTPASLAAPVLVQMGAYEPNPMIGGYTICAWIAHGAWRVACLAHPTPCC